MTKNVFFIDEKIRNWWSKVTVATQNTKYILIPFTELHHSLHYIYSWVWTDVDVSCNLIGSQRLTSISSVSFLICFRSPSAPPSPTEIRVFIEFEWYDLISSSSVIKNYDIY